MALGRGNPGVSSPSMTRGCDSTQVPCPCWSRTSLSFHHHQTEVGSIPLNRALGDHPVAALWVPAPPHHPLAVSHGCQGTSPGPSLVSPHPFSWGKPRSAHCVASTSLQLCSGGDSILKLLATLFLLARPMKCFICQESNCWLGFSLAPAAPTPAKQPQPTAVASTAAKHPAPKPSPEGANGNGEPGPGDTARGREHKPRATQVQHPRRGYHAQGAPQQHPDPIPATGALGTPCTQGTRGFSQDKPACQGSWVINISLPGLFLARGRAAEAFPQLFQHAAPLRGVRSSHTGQVSTLQTSPGDVLGCVLPFQPAPGHA